MGIDLIVSIEVYNIWTKEWMVMNIQDFYNDEYIEFNQTNLLEKIKPEVIARNNDSEYQMTEDDINNEAFSELTDYIGISIGRNYPLFHYIAQAIKEYDGKFRSVSGTRGLPVDSSYPRDLFNYAFYSFLTLSELLRIDFNDRIDIIREMSIEKYSNGAIRQNHTGKLVVISERDYLNMDEAAKSELIRDRVTNFHIKIDNPTYLKGNYEIEDFLGVIDQMKYFRQKYDISPNNIRMILVFSY